MADSPLAQRFPLLDRPVAVPGSCMACGKGSVRVFDLRRNFMQHGAAYLCEECVLEMAHSLNLVSAELVSAAEAEASQSVLGFLRKKELRVVTDEYYALVRGSLTDLLGLANVSDDMVHSLLGDTTVAEAGADSIEPAKPSDEGTRKKRRPRKETDSSAGDEGPTSVSGSNGDGADTLFDFGES